MSKLTSETLTPDQRLAEEIIDVYAKYGRLLNREHIEFHNYFVKVLQELRDKNKIEAIYASTNNKRNSSAFRL